RVIASGAGADVRLEAIAGLLTLNPASGQSAMITSGGDIELHGQSIVWSGINSAGDNVTVVAAGNLLVNSPTFELTSDSLSFEATENLSVAGTIKATGNVFFVAVNGNQSNASLISAKPGT
ncbi:MAG: hypothetical protein ACK6EB_45155, partial [Planctomyces sp.]